MLKGKGIESNQSTPFEEEGETMPVIQEFNKGELGSRSFDPRTTERPLADKEIREKMDREVVALGYLMKDAGVWWQLDGALNISLEKGEYIGTHVDVDISVLREDVTKLETHLKEHGYGLFLRKREGEGRIFRRVGATAFKYDEDNPEWQLRIAAVNEKGEIRTDVDLPSVEVAIIEHDEKGNNHLGWRDTILPEEWLKGKTINFRGASINLSHPARFLFNKVWFTRGYDEKDLEQFIKNGTLSKKDLDRVEKLATPILKSFEEDKEIGKEHADLIRRRFEKLHELINK